MKFIYLLPVLFLLSITFSEAQTPDCGFDERHAELMETDPNYEKAFYANNKRIREIIESGILDNNNKVLPPVYTIPVVVHVFYKT